MTQAKLSRNGFGRFGSGDRGRGNTTGHCSGGLFLPGDVRVQNHRYAFKESHERDTDSAVFPITWKSADDQSRTLAQHGRDEKPCMQGFYDPTTIVDALKKRF